MRTAGIVKPSKEQSKELLRNIKVEILAHSGRPAILFTKDIKGITPHYVILNGLQAKCPCYTPDGEFRGFIYYSLRPVDLLIGHLKVFYFEDI